MTGWTSQCLKQKKRGPVLKNRLVEDAEMHKGPLDREPLRAADGVKYFRDTLRPHFIKGAQSVPLWGIFYQLTRARRGNIEICRVDRQVVIAFEALQGCLDGHVTAVHQERRRNQYLADVTQENEERQRRKTVGTPHR